MPADGQAAAAAGAVAHLHGCGVAVADDDLVEVHAQVVGDDLREGRLVALTVGRGAGVGGDRPRRLHAHHRALEGPEAAHLHVDGLADAEQRAVVARHPLLLLAPQRVHASQLQRLHERPVVLAGVVVLAGRSRVRERAGGDEVLPADLLGRLAQLGGDDVDQPLQVVGGLGPAGPAVGGHRRRVGEHAGRLQVDVGELVDAHAHAQREVGDEREDGIGADVGRHLHAKRADGAVVLHRRLEVGDLGPTVGGGHHVLDARLHPLERQPVVAGEGGQHHVLRVAAELHAEAAAHVGVDDPDEVLLDADDVGEVGAQGVGGLVRGPHDDAAGGRIGRGHARAGLHGDAAQPLADHPLLHHASGPGEDRVGIALLDLVLVLDVLGRVGVQLGGAVGHGGEDVGHRRQRLPVDLHRVDAVVGSVVGVGHDGRHGLADVADDLGRQRPVLTAGRAGAGAALGGGAGGRQRLGQLPDVLAGHDHAHARHLQRRPRVDLLDAGVGVGAAHEGHPQHAGHARRR